MDGISSRCLQETSGFAIRAQVLGKEDSAKRVDVAKGPVVEPQSAVRCLPDQPLALEFEPR